MKKLALIFMILISSFGAIAGPCTAGWVACIDAAGYPNAGCDAGWDACMEALY